MWLSGRVCPSCVSPWGPPEPWKVTAGKAQTATVTAESPRVQGPC